MEPIYQIFLIISIVLGAVIHEYCHAWMAYQLGDPTAKYLGRLTLNPLVHLDPMGSIFLPFILWFLGMISGGPLFIFAYAKPVPVNFLNLRDQKNGPALVSFAGPAANLITALFFGILIQLLPFGNFVRLLGIIVYANILLAIFNLIPLPPLDGSKILFRLLPASWEKTKIFLQQYGLFLLIIFIFFFFQLIYPIIFVLFKLITGYNLLYLLLAM